MMSTLSRESFLNQTIYPIYTELVTLIKDTSQAHQSLTDLPSPYNADVQKIGEALRKLEEMVAALSQFPVTEDTAAWSKLRHDTCTPVNALKGYSELLLEDMAEASDNVKQTLGQILNISKQILAAIGRLRVENSGSIETPVASPLTPSAPLPQQAPPISPSKNTETGCILVVDDNETNRDLLKQRLEREGHKVILAVNGTEALQKVTTDSVDVVLLDLMMPDISGYDVLLKLKADENYRNLPIIMISAVGEIDQIVQCIEAGAEDYLPKPFNPVLLRARIGACLDKKQLRQREQAYMNLLKAAIESIDHGFVIFNAQATCALFNSTFQKLYPHVAIGQSLEHVYQQQILEGSYDMGEKSARTWLSDRKQYWQQSSIDYMDRWADGRIFEVNVFQAADGSHVGIYKDITDQHTEEQRLAYLAYHDGLTGLKNRKFFLEALQRLTPADKAAVLYMDLDGFKGINDTLGHEFGDRVLRYVAQRLGATVRSGDTVARLGGDEFCILLMNLGTEAEVTPIIERLFKNVGKEYTTDGKTGTFGLSVGCAFYPTHATKPAELLTAADTAMYSSKKAGKGTYRFYTV